MLRDKALLKAAACARLAEAEIDPERRAVLGYVSHLWKTLAEDASHFDPDQLDAQYEQLLAVEAMLADEIVSGTVH